LFAIVPDAGLIRAGQKLVLEAPGSAAPDEIVLLIVAERAP
jgi:hypothetical protein